MKAVLSTIVLGSVLVSASAQADGFRCSSESGVGIQIYNQTQPGMGTRNAAVMILTDESVGHGRKTIARFTSGEGLVVQMGATYIGNVDLRFNNTGRKGEWIAGTKLGEVDKVVVDLDFNYLSPLAHGEELGGEMTIVKRNGDQLVDSLVCTRYLKN